MTLSTRPVLLALLMVCAGLESAGCGPSITTNVRSGHSVRRAIVRGSAAHALTRAAREIPCDYDGMVIETLGSGGHRIEGCGVVMTYTCVGEYCAPDARERSAPMLSAPVAPRRYEDPATRWSDEDVRMALTRIHEDVLACLAAERQGARMTVELMRTGRMRRMAVTPTLTPPEGRCVDERLSREDLGRRVTQPRVVALDFRRGAVAARQSLEATAPGSEPVMPAPASTAPEAAARAVIDSRAPAILACVGADAIAMQVSWTREGRLDAMLRGEQQGTAEEGCVRAVVQALSIPAPGAPGTLLHALQR